MIDSQTPRLQQYKPQLLSLSNRRTFGALLRIRKVPWIFALQSPLDHSGDLLLQKTRISLLYLHLQRTALYLVIQPWKRAMRLSSRRSQPPQ